MRMTASIMNEVTEVRSLANQTRLVISCVATGCLRSIRGYYCAPYTDPTDWYRT